MKKILLAAALVATSGLASAQGYAGALIGLSKLSARCTVSCDTSDTGFKVYGGYEVMPNLSVEVAYTDFGKFSNAAGYAQIKTNAVSVAAAYRIPFDASFSGVGRLGVANVKSKWTGGSGSKARLYGGVGLDYALSKDIKVVGGIDFTQAEVNGESGGIYLVGVGAQVGF